MTRSPRRLLCGDSHVGGKPWASGFRVVVWKVTLAGLVAGIDRTGATASPCWLPEGFSKLPPGMLEDRTLWSQPGVDQPAGQPQPARGAFNCRPAVLLGRLGKRR